MEPSYRNRLGLRIAIAAAGLEILLILVTAIMGGWSFGIGEIANDLGKTVFHLFIMPIAVWLLIRDFPVRQWRHHRSAGPIRRIAVWLVPTILALLAVGIVIRDEGQNFFIAVKTGDDRWLNSTQVITPVDLGPKELRRKLQDRYVAARKAFIKGLPAEEAREQYLKAVYQELGPGNHFAKHANFRSWIGMLLSFLGAMVGGSTLWIGLMMLFARPAVEPEGHETESVLISISLLALWFPFRFYSEWYFDFYASVFKVTMFIPAFVLAITASLVVFLARQAKGRGAVGTFVVSGIALIGSVVSILGAKFYQPMARALGKMGIESWSAVYFFLTVMFGAFAYWLSIPETSKKRKTTID